MPAYGDATIIKQRSGIAPDDLSNVADQTELDALIQNLNERGSDAIERWCSRDFEHHTNDTAVLDGNGRLDEDGHGRIRLEGRPILSISEIRINGTSLPSDEYRIVPLTGKPETNVGVIQRKHDPWPEGWENIEVDYDWGYQSPPSGVRAVAEDLVIDALRAAQRNNSGGAVVSESMDGFSVRYFEGSVERTQEHKDRLQPYRRVGLGVS